MPAEHARIYAACWAAFLVVALIVAVRSREALARSLVGYPAAVRAPWKIVTYVISAGSFVAAAPYTGDPTWDRVDAAFMSAFTILTAPWSIGTLYRALRGMLPRTLLIPAMAVWLFSASWSYDLYIWHRDGFYPSAWMWNLVESSVLYAAAGMLWSLDHRSGRGVHFAFQEATWAKPSGGLRVAVYALAFVGLVVGMMLPFVFEHLSTGNP